MKTRLTLQEKLRDLRDERKLTLAEVASATGITLPTFGRIESSEDNRANYQDIEILAKFYGVSADYLCLIPCDFAPRLSLPSHCLIWIVSKDKSSLGLLDAT